MDYYEVLGITKLATTEEIKQAYRNLSKKYHPDVNDAPNAAAFFRLISEAYETLYNQQKRTIYDSVKNYNPNVSSNDDYENEQYHYHETQTSTVIINKTWIKIIMFPIKVIMKIVCFVLIVIFAFFEMLLNIVSFAGTFIGIILIGIGVIALIFSLFASPIQLEPCIWSLAIAFIGFILPYISAFLPMPLTLIKNLLISYVFT